MPEQPYVGDQFYYHREELVIVGKTVHGDFVCRPFGSTNYTQYRIMHWSEDYQWQEVT